MQNEPIIMFCFHRCVLLFITLLALSAANAQRSISLSDAIQIGLENSYQIRIAETQREAAANSNDWAVAGRYPTINLNLNNQNGYRNVNNPISFIPELYSFSTGFQPGIEGSFTLFDGYRVRYNKERLAQQELQSDQQVALAVENTMQNIITAYYQALLQQEQVKVLADVLELSRDRIKYERARQEFGQAGTFDLLQTQDAYLNDSTNYLPPKVWTTVSSNDSDPAPTLSYTLPAQDFVSAIGAQEYEANGTNFVMQIVYTNGLYQAQLIEQE